MAPNGLELCGLFSRQSWVHGARSRRGVDAPNGKSQTDLQEIPMFRTNPFRTMIAAALLTVTAAAVSSAHAQVASAGTDQPAAVGTATSLDQASERLMIVNRNTGRVIYDDGRNDLFCATSVYIAGYDDWGRPIRRRSMRCR
jgi:hypothetical protein